MIRFAPQRPGRPDLEHIRVEEVFRAGRGIAQAETVRADDQQAGGFGGGGEFGQTAPQAWDIRGGQLKGKCFGLEF